MAIVALTQTATAVTYTYNTLGLACASWRTEGALPCHQSCQSDTYQKQMCVSLISHACFFQCFA